MPPQRHAISALRREIGITQSQLADLIGYSLQMVKKVECMDNPLSDNMASAISEQTGASYNWIRRGDAKRPMVATDGSCYSKEVFERVQSGILFNLGMLNCCEFSNALKSRFDALVKAALESPSPEVRLYRISALVNNLENQIAK